MPGKPSLLAQMNALIAYSDVFDALFQSGFVEHTGTVEVRRATIFFSESIYIFYLQSNHNKILYKEIESFIMMT